MLPFLLIGIGLKALAKLTDYDFSISLHIVINIYAVTGLTTLPVGFIAP
jgi:hypothetical protein